MTILIGTWDAGLVSIDGTTVREELLGRSVRSLVDDGRGGVLAIAGGNALCRRSSDGRWSTIVEIDCELSCCVASGDVVFLGTSDARMVRVDRDGTHHWLTGFGNVAGRERWYAGSAIVDGRVLGPPLGVRSLAATCDRTVLLANVHVGGIPRSQDAGVSWEPTIDIESDVHQVCAHASRSGIVIAAGATGLCTSRDGGATWEIDERGLHAPHCSAVALGRKHLFISASTGPFAERSAVYRRPIESGSPPHRMAGGMPDWLEGIVDTDCIATRDATVAVIDGSGSAYVSHDDGDTWSARVDVPTVANASCLHVC